MESAPNRVRVTKLRSDKKVVVVVTSTTKKENIGAAGINIVWAVGRIDKVEFDPALTPFLLMLTRALKPLQLETSALMVTVPPAT